MQIGLQTASGDLGAFQEFFNARQGMARGGNAGFDGFVGAIEIVPRDRLNVGPQDENGVAFPAFELMFLRCADSARDDLKNI